MKLTYNSLNEIADFQAQKMRPGYEGIYYAVLFLKNGYSFDGYRGLGYYKEKYNKGYYVIPVNLKAFHWICGDKVVMRVAEDRGYVSKSFKHYFGIGKDLIGQYGHEHYIDDKELYDNPDEAITRAKELDKLMNIVDKINNVGNKIRYHKHLLDNLRYKMWVYRNGTEKKTKRQELEYQLDVLALENRTALIKKLDEQRDELYKKKSKYQEFNPGRV